MKYPKPNTTPLGRDAIAGALPKRELVLLESILDETDLYCVERTGTTIDVGSWIKKRRVCACATNFELVLIAAGREAYAERIPFSNLYQSEYNHVTGEVALAPAVDTQISGLKMEPLKAMAFLALIHKENMQNA